MLQSKPEMKQAAQAWDSFWRNEWRGPLIAAVVPKPGVEPAPKPSAYLAGPEMDVAAFAAQGLRWVETHDFLGAAVPFVYLEFAADQFATFLGADLVFPSPEQGGWPLHPYADCPLETVEIRFERNGKWWRHVSAIAETLMEQWAGKLLIAAPTLVSNLDALVALRGANQVLLDLMDCPEVVHRALEQIDRAHAEVLDAYAKLLDFETYGSINRHGMYTTGRTNLPQCDFSCLISPAMFAEFGLPYLKREMQRLDGAEYHLDGPGALRHLEALCALEELDVVQWVAGAGNDQRDWSDLYRQIDRLGKGQILGGNAAALERRRHELSAGRLFWNLRAGSRAEAEDVIARAAE